MMAEQLAWDAGKANGEDSLLAAQSDTEAYFGRLRNAREYTRRAVQAAQKADLTESAATWEVEAGMREVMFGNLEEAQKDAEEALKTAPDSKDVRALAALIFARAGDEVEAQKITDNLRASYVSNVVMQKAWLPVVRAQISLHKKQNQEAIQLLEVVTPFEKGQLTGNQNDSCMIPTYLRGEANLNLPKGKEALASGIPEDRGEPGNHWKLLVRTTGETRRRTSRSGDGINRGREGRL